MKPALRPVVCALAVTLCVLPASAGTRVEDPDIRWEAYVGERLDGSTLEGRIGRIRVPSNRARGGDATQEIAFVHYASDNPEPGPPIVFLVGGPGPSGIEWCAQTAADPRLRLLDFADVIGIDQRGTGLSRPDLSAGPEFSYELPLDRAITRDEVVAAWQDMAARSLESWRAQGLDPADYNTAESADDVDAVRAALGFEQIVPWGTSYGSHLGLAYLRRHPEHAARAVLMKVEAPDATFKLPATSQRRLEHVAELVRRDEQLAERLPDLVGSVREILAGLREQPVTLTTSRGGQTLSVVLGAYDVQCALSQALADSQNVAGLPFAVHLMTQGFYEHMLGFALRNRFGELGSPMAYLMDCASGTTAARRERIERELADEGNLLGVGLPSPSTS